MRSDSPGPAPSAPVLRDTLRKVTASTWSSVRIKLKSCHMSSEVSGTTRT